MVFAQKLEGHGICFTEARRFSFLLIYLLKPVLRQVLIETCGTNTRAEFWVMFTQLMLIISPLLIVIYFAPTTDSVPINAAEAIQDTLFRSLLGDFIALSMIGQVIWRSIKNFPEQSGLHDQKLSEPHE